jgi:NitT/TauT family transport system substrate-binding protein
MRAPSYGRGSGLLLAAALVVACATPGPPARTEAPAATPIGTVATISAAAAPTAVPPVEKLQLAYASTSVSWAPGYVAVEQGLFAKQGLDVELTYIASGTTVMQAMLAGDLKFALNSGAEVVAAYVGGAPVRFLMGWVNTFPVLFMVDPSIAEPAQLRGTTIGITRYGSQPHVAARQALLKWGLNPDTDVSYLQLGGVPEILGGMQTGAVIGGAFSPPTNALARRLGYRALGDLSQMGIAYQASSLTALEPYMQANPDVVRRFVRALVEGVHVTLTDDVATRAAAAKYTQIDDAELLDDAIAYYRTVAQRVPYPTPEGIQTILDDLAQNDSRAKTMQPRDMIDTSALEELDRAGLFRELAGGAGR